MVSGAEHGDRGLIIALDFARLGLHCSDSPK
jgi:hypothetical protein